MNTLTNEEPKTPRMAARGGGSDAVYGIGLVGAWVYFMRRATTREERVKAFFKGFVWPAFLVYMLFEFLEKK